MVAPKGTGSLRERRPGVWEIRVAAGSDPVTGRTLQRSIVFRGSAEEAEKYRRELAGEYAERRGAARAAPMVTVGDLLKRWLQADHPWRPSTAVSYRSNVRALTADAMLADTRVMSLSPRLVRAAAGSGCCGQPWAGPTTSGSSKTTRSGACEAPAVSNPAGP